MMKWKIKLIVICLLLTTAAAVAAYTGGVSFRTAGSRIITDHALTYVSEGSSLQNKVEPVSTKNEVAIADIYNFQTSNAPVTTSTPAAAAVIQIPVKTAGPTAEPTAEPTVEPTAAPKAVPTAEPTPVPTPVPIVTPIPADLTAIAADEARMLDLINSTRAQYGLNPLVIDPALQTIAHLKAQDLVIYNYFAHQSPTYGSPFDMLAQYGIGYGCAGENLAGYSTVEIAFNAWMNSDGHRQNILSPNFTLTGIAIAEGSIYGKIFVQMFVGR